MAIKAKVLKEKKIKAVEEIKKKLADSKLLILTDYRGMTVKQITDLRRQLRANKAEYRVYKNTYVVKALPENLTGITDNLTGPIAIVFGFEDVVLPAKTLMKFIGENEKPGLVMGVVDSAIYTDKQIKELSKLPGKQELIAMVVRGMKSPLFGMVNVMQGPIRKLVYALEAIKKQRSEGGEK